VSLQSLLTVISLIALDKTPSVDVNDHTAGCAFAPKQIETAYSLSKCLDNVLGVSVFVCRQLGDEPGLFTVGITSDKTVDDWGFSGFGVRKVGSYRVDLDVLGY
jgi:hypothetical protein